MKALPGSLWYRDGYHEQEVFSQQSTAISGVYILLCATLHTGNLVIKMNHMMVNQHHPEFSHVKCTMTPSIKQGLYQVYIFLYKDGNLGSVVPTTCDCVAG